MTKWIFPMFQKTSFLSDSELLQKIDSDHLFRDRIGRYFPSEKKKKERENHSIPSFWMTQSQYNNNIFLSIRYHKPFNILKYTNRIFSSYFNIK